MNLLSRSEYLNLAALVGHENAARLVALKFGYGREARIAVAQFVLPNRHEVCRPDGVIIERPADASDD